MNTYQTIIESCKAGEEESFVMLVEKFMPLIKKYTRLLYKDDAEDVKQEMLMALWEASQKIEKYDNEGECTKYFSNALRCRFLELYRKSRKINDNAIDVEDSVMESEKSDDHMNYSYVNLRQDIMFLIEDFSTPVKEMCIKMAFEDLSDAEIAKKFNVSRQYTNRIRRNFRSKLSNYLEV